MYSRVDRLLICQYCGDCFMSQGNRSMHEAYNCPKNLNRRERIKCDLCPELIVGKSAMRNHLMMVHKKETFTCDVCGDVMMKRSKYGHMKMHNQVICPVCNKPVTQLKGHMKTHEKPVLVPCTVCKKPIRTTEMNAHLKTHTEKPRPCEDCEKVISFSAMRKHRRLKCPGNNHPDEPQKKKQRIE